MLNRNNQKKNYMYGNRFVYVKTSDLLAELEAMQATANEALGKIDPELQKLNMEEIIADAIKMVEEKHENINKWVTELHESAKDETEHDEIDTFKSKIDLIAKDSIKKIKEIHANYAKIESGIAGDTIEKLKSKNEK